MITVKHLDSDRVRYSTILKIDNVYITLYVDKYVHYQSKSDLENPQFEEIFYWPIEKMTNKAFNHLSYNQIITSDYSKPDGGNYELRWKTVIINKIIGGINISLIEGKEIKSKPIAIPPSKEKRIDYILDNFSYIYNSKEDIKQAIKIQVENNKFEIL